MLDMIGSTLTCTFRVPICPNASSQNAAKFGLPWDAKVPCPAGSTGLVHATSTAQVHEGYMELSVRARVCADTNKTMCSIPL